MEKSNKLSKRADSIQLAHIESVDLVSEISATMTAFSNSEGGVILIGINKNGKTVGVNPVTDIEKLKTISNEYCDPAVLHTCNTSVDGHKIVLEVSIIKSTTKITKALDDFGKKVLYVRIGDQNIVMNKLYESVRRFSLGNNPKPLNLSDIETSLVSLISTYDGCSMSKIYKLSDLSRKEIDLSLTRLIAWNIISMDFNGETSLLKLA
jgi:predicted HTH transcriptional regulator